METGNPTAESLVGEESLEDAYELSTGVDAAVEEDEFDVRESSWAGKFGQEDETTVGENAIRANDFNWEEGGFEEGEEMVEEYFPTETAEEEIFEEALPELTDERLSNGPSTDPEKSSLNASRKVLEEIMSDIFYGLDEETNESTSPNEVFKTKFALDSVRKILKPEKILHESDYAYHMPSLIDLYIRSTTFHSADHQYFSCCMKDVSYQHALAMTMANSNLILLKNECILLRKDHSKKLQNKVKILSGGMAGLEPLFYGYVGQGMLTGVAIGDFNYPPRPSTVYKAIAELSLGHEAGVIVIVENRSDVRLIFGQAMEKARSEGVLIDMVVICDNARDNVRDDEVGRGSLTGLLVAFKVAGAMSEAGKSMADIFLTLNKFNMSSISSTIGQLRVEVGTDFKGNLGTPISCSKLRTLIQTMLEYLISPSRYFSLKLSPLSKVHLLINNFVRDDLFLNAALSEVLRQLFVVDTDVNGIYAGTFVTGRPGLCITLIKDKQLELSQWLDERTAVQFWPKSPSAEKIPKVTVPKAVFRIPELPPLGPLFTQNTTRMIPLIIGSFCNEMGESQGSLDYLDPLKEFGSSLLRCVKVIADHNLKELIDLRAPFNTLKYVAHVMDKSGMGFTVALISILLKAVANDFLKYSHMEDLDHNMWGNALSKGVMVAKTYSGVRRSESSMLDVVGSVGQRLIELPLDKSGLDIMDEMLDAANEGIEKNKSGGRHLVGNKDPASVVAVMLFKCIAETRRQVIQDS